MRLIPLTAGKSAIVDDDVYAAMSRFKWWAKKTERKGRTVWHAVRQVSRRSIYMHREIAGVGVDREIDHRNGDGLDNRKKNLRACSHQQNMANRHSVHARSGVLGVCFISRLKSKPWSAVIMVGYKKYHLGYFATKAEASEARRSAAFRAFGEFAAEAKGGGNDGTAGSL
jgi:hypothetical protein